MTERHPIDTAAALLHVSRRTLERWIADGRIAALKIGHRTLIEQPELDDFYARARAEAARKRFNRAKAARKRAA